MPTRKKFHFWKIRISTSLSTPDNSHAGWLTFQLAHRHTQKHTHTHAHITHTHMHILTWISVGWE